MNFYRNLGDMMLEKELQFLTVDEKYGGNQYKFRHPIMNRGGCSTVCACHAAALLARKNPDKKALYPYDTLDLSQKEFTKFADTMYKYVAPGFRGMSNIHLFERGFLKYAQSVNTPVEIRLLSGESSFSQARAFINHCLDLGLCLQYLLLHHQDPAFEEIEWHWFTVTGYKGNNIVYSTWGEKREADLEKLWQTGHKEKGGLVCIF